MLSVALVMLAGSMVYAKSNTKKSERLAFLISFLMLIFYGLVLMASGSVDGLSIDWMENPVVDVFIHGLAFLNIFFVFRVLSLETLGSQ